MRWRGISGLCASGRAPGKLAGRAAQLSEQLASREADRDQRLPSSRRWPRASATRADKAEHRAANLQEHLGLAEAASKKLESRIERTRAQASSTSGALPSSMLPRRPRPVAHAEAEARANQAETKAAKLEQTVGKLRTRTTQAEGHASQLENRAATLAVEAAEATERAAKLERSASDEHQRAEALAAQLEQAVGGHRQAVGEAEERAAAAHVRGRSSSRPRRSRPNGPRPSCSWS